MSIDDHGHYIPYMCLIHFDNENNCTCRSVSNLKRSLPSVTGSQSRNMAGNIRHLSMATFSTHVHVGFITNTAFPEKEGWQHEDIKCVLKMVLRNFLGIFLSNVLNF
jgi:hypothetical protein